MEGQGHFLTLAQGHLQTKLKTCSPQNPLGHSKPNFMWSLLGEGGAKVYINDPGHMTKMAAMLKNAQNLKKASAPEPVYRFP